MAARSERRSVTAETPLSNLDFVAFDTETTGCEAATGRIVEIGAVRFRLDGTELDRFSRLINPLRPIPASVISIHGITNEMVRDCPDEAAVLPQFLAFLGDPTRTILMAHNAPFDLGFVGAALGRCALTPPLHAVVDTVRLSRRRAARLPSHALGSLVKIFGIAAGTEHRGLSDSVALKQVFLNLIHRPPAPATAGELFAYAPAGRFPTEPAAPRGRFPDVGRRSFRGRSSSRGPFARPAFGSSSLEGEPTPLSNSIGLSSTGESEHVRRLSAAIAAGRFVNLVYEGGRASGAKRRVTPLRLVESASIGYLLAFCHADGIQKTYRLDRIRELVVE